MNVYDFDGTIYRGDSTVDFYLFALKQKPSLLRYLPKQAFAFVLYKLKKLDKTGLKERFFSFLSAINTETVINDFWDHNHHKINNWYLRQQQSEDIVISASPEFLLRPICQRLGICHLIASNVDAHSGKFLSENCRGKEKVCRLTAEYPAIHIHQFYSDSFSDLPLAQMSDTAFLVKKGTVNPWKGL